VNSELEVSLGYLVRLSKKEGRGEERKKERERERGREEGREMRGEKAFYSTKCFFLTDLLGYLGNTNIGKYIMLKVILSLALKIDSSLTYSPKHYSANKKTVIMWFYFPQ
jgi:hypothetical protein